MYGFVTHLHRVGSRNARTGAMEVDGGGAQLTTDKLAPVFLVMQQHILLLKYWREVHLGDQTFEWGPQAPLRTAPACATFSCCSFSFSSLCLNKVTFHLLRPEETCINITHTLHPAAPTFQTRASLPTSQFIMPPPRRHY